MEVTIDAYAKSDAVNEFLNVVFAPEKELLEKLIAKYQESPQGLIEFNEIMSMITQAKGFEPIYLDVFFKTSSRFREIIEYIQHQQELLIKGQRCEGIRINLKTDPAGPTIPSNECILPYSLNEMQEQEYEARKALGISYQASLKPDLYNSPPGVTGSIMQRENYPLNESGGRPCSSSIKGPILSSLLPPYVHRPLTFKISTSAEDCSKMKEKNEFNEKLVTVYTYGDFFKSDGTLRCPQPPSLIQSQKYTCQECNKSYAIKRSLYNHLRVHKGGMKKSGQCKVCNKLNKNSNLAHESKPNYKHICDVCGRAFDKEWILLLHSRSHSDFKPYGCGHCGKSYSEKAKLRTHVRSHSSNRAFKCPDCEKTFIYKGHLNRHRKVPCKMVNDVPIIESKEMRHGSIPPKSPLEVCTIPNTVPARSDSITPAQKPLPHTPLFHLSEIYSSLASIGSNCSPSQGGPV